jgi:hypothetical protein
MERTTSPHISQQKRFRVTALRKPGAPNKVPAFLTEEIVATGPVVALRTFFWRLEEEFGDRAGRYFKPANVTYMPEREEYRDASSDA